jgi:two-component system chemotaxis sensor kinase CheA
VPDADSTDFTDLLPDYVAECDEHLTAAGRTLLAVEPAPDRIGRDQLDELFRAFHTIKGLSGMMGVAEAERLAHGLEGYLGAVRRGETALTATGVDVLIEGVRSLEQVVAACRDRRPAPDFEAVIGRAAALVPDRQRPPTPDTSMPAGSAAAVVPADTQARLEAALRQRQQVWRVTFTPSPDLAARGISVNTVRERLQTVGEILRAEPHTMPAGGIAFVFLVAARAADFSATVAGAGLTAEPYAAGPPAAAGPAPPGLSPAPLAPANLVRVDLGRLDDLMRAVGELVITRARLDAGLSRAAAKLPAGERRQLAETTVALERQLRTLREGIMRVRLVPVRDVFARMRFVVRDLARETAKDVALDLAGEDTEIDKFVVERLADPLLHLVRNAVSHGIEPAAARAAAGKPPRGRVGLRAAAAGGAVVIDLEDDGRGIDPHRVFARARALGLVPAGAPADPAGVLDLICTPGFSTQETADRASGRGVGMDVVRRAVEDLGGDLALDNRPGHGARFTVRLPLSLAIADALIVAVGDQSYAVPQAAVREVVPVDAGGATALENNELLRHASGVLPLLRLHDLFGTPRPPGAFVALVVGEGRRAVALGADRVVALREIVVRPLADPLVQAPGLAGATELGDGRAVLILDAAGLARLARTRRRPAADLLGV